jgi:hypothetical protein
LLCHIIRSAKVRSFTQADFLSYAEAIAGVGSMGRLTRVQCAFGVRDGGRGAHRSKISGAKL